MGNNELDIDVKKIMDEICEENILIGIPAFEDIPIRNNNKNQISVEVTTEDNYLEQFVNNLEYLNRNHEVPYYWDLGSSKIKKFIKRVIRKVIKFLLYPITQWQTQFNVHTVICLNAVRSYLEGSNEQREQNEALRQEIEALKITIAHLRETNEKTKLDFEKRETALESQLATLVKEIEDMKVH